jgi:hypothetical protein
MSEKFNEGDAMRAFIARLDVILGLTYEFDDEVVAMTRASGRINPEHCLKFSQSVRQAAYGTAPAPTLSVAAVDPGVPLTGTE